MYFNFTKKKAIFRKTIDTIAERRTMGSENKLNVELEAMAILDFSLILTSAEAELAEDQVCEHGRERKRVCGGWGGEVLTESLERYLAFGDTNF